MKNRIHARFSTTITAKVKAFAVIVVCTFQFHSLSAQANLARSSEHAQYWSIDGKTTLLLGGSIEDNLFQLENLEEHLNLLNKAGGNYVRNTMSTREVGDVWPFSFDTSEGLYNLDKWNEEYWKRFSRFLQMTAERGIIVQIEIWATFDFYREYWANNPFNPKNNSNYTPERSKLPVEINTHPVWTENPFFWSIPNQHNNIPILKYQQRFVDKMLSYTLSYGHVLYCIDNETSVTSSWGKFWADYIRTKAKENQKKVFITEMWDPHDLSHISHRETSDHPETYDFVEISQNNHQLGQTHWDNGLAQIQRLEALEILRPVTNIKTYGADSGRHGHGTKNGIESFIRSCFFGSAAVRFHRPDTGLGLNKKAQSVIKSLHMISSEQAFFKAKPRNDLLSNRSNNEAYCRGVANQYYAIYFTNGGDVTLALLGTAGETTLRWLNVMTSKWEDGQKVKGGKAIKISAPSQGDWISILDFDK